MARKTKVALWPSPRGNAATRQGPPVQPKRFAEVARVFVKHGQVIEYGRDFLVVTPEGFLGQAQWARRMA
jgi:hypothetical protein